MDQITSLLNDINQNNQKLPKVYSTTVISNVTRQKLLSYQEKHVVKLVNILVKNCIALDSSETGTGKTYAAVAVAKETNRKPIIVCPKTLIINWMSVMDHFGVEYYDIVNYETIRNGKTYTSENYRFRKSSSYLEILDDSMENFTGIKYQWKVPKDTIVIFDEVHRCKDPSTDNGKLLLSVKQLINEKIPALILSATISDKLNDMKISFYLFGIIPEIRIYNSYIKSLKHKYPKYKLDKSKFKNKVQYQIASSNVQALYIYEEIREFTSRIKIKDLGDKFPSNQIVCQQFIAPETDEIEKAYQQITDHMVELKEHPGENHLAKIQKLKQEIELRKAPIFIEQAQLYLEENKSVIIFVNYLKTLEILVEALNIKCKIYGNQTIEERQKSIDQFQSNQEKIIICQMRAGSVGIGLHDISGEHPRVTLINFPDSSSDLLQALGRAPRSGAKSIVLQRIIFVANINYEKIIMNNINRKLANLSIINDGDLTNYRYQLKKK